MYKFFVLLEKLIYLNVKKKIYVGLWLMIKVYFSKIFRICFVWVFFLFVIFWYIFIDVDF